MLFDIHSFFFFLGTIEGDLLKRFIELILLVFVFYMVASEYTKNKRIELRYLIFGFGILAFEKFLSTLLLTFTVFGDFPPYLYMTYSHIIMHSLELA